MIIVHALMKVQPDKRTDFLEQAQKAVEATRAEEGNRGYRLVEDMENSNTFLMIEQWADANAVESHKNSPHFIGFVQAVRGYLLAPLDIEAFTAQEASQ